MNTDNNKLLATAPLGGLMLKFSIPCIMSLLVSSLYNIVDQIFIGRGVGYLGNGATNVVFPITIITLAIALLIGDGIAAYLSICQGRGDSETSHKSVGNAVVLSVGFGIALAAVFLIFGEKLLWAFGATDNNITYAREYMRYISLGIPAYLFANTLNSIIRADGSPQFAMGSTLIGCVINVILDPIAIFVLGWGMRGAALATIAGQYVSAALAVYYLFHTKGFRLGRTSFALRPRLLAKVLPLGISSFLTQISIVVIMAVSNNMLVKYGAQSVYGADIPLTVFGIVMKVFQIVVSVVVGIAAGCQPVVGYNLGAGKVTRVKQLYRLMIAAELAVGVISMLCFELFPLQIIGIFGSEDGLYNQFAVLAFRIYLSTIALCCVQKATSIFLQSLGKPVPSMALSLLRDFLLMVPLVICLPAMLGVTGMLYAAPIADVISAAAALAVILRVLGRMKNDTEPQRAAAALRRAEPVTE